MSAMRETRVLSAAAAEPYNAVVFGSTGAVGKAVVRELAESDKCKSVVAIVRRATKVAEWRVKEEEDSKFSKVEVKRINYDTLSTSLPEAQMRKKQVVFYCLGTTRKDAGSAAAFKKVDLEYLTNVCKLCRVAGVDHFSLVSSQGSSTSSPFLYPKTKGQGEKKETQASASASSSAAAPADTAPSDSLDHPPHIPHRERPPPSTPSSARRALHLLLSPSPHRERPPTTPSRRSLRFLPGHTPRNEGPPSTPSRRSLRFLPAQTSSREPTTPHLEGNPPQSQPGHAPNVEGRPPPTPSRLRRALRAFSFGSHGNNPEVSSRVADKTPSTPSRRFRLFSPVGGAGSSQSRGGGGGGIGHDPVMESSSLDTTGVAPVCSTPLGGGADAGAGGDGTYRKPLVETSSLSAGRAPEGGGGGGIGGGDAGAGEHAALNGSSVGTVRAPESTVPSDSLSHEARLGRSGQEQSSDPSLTPSRQRDSTDGDSRGISRHATQARATVGAQSIERVVKEAGYPHTTIWRPGLLGRGEKARGVEKMARLLVTPMPAETLAAAMVRDAESKLGSEPEEEVAVFNNKDMRRLASSS